MTILLKGGLVYCEAEGIKTQSDILIKDGMIAEIGQNLSAEGAEVLDCSGRVVTNAFVGLEAHVGEPGQRWREDFGTGGRSAAAGGFTWLAASPSGSPCIDDEEVASSFIRRSKDTSAIHIVPAASLTVGGKGENLSEVGLLARAGVALFTDSGVLIKDTTVLRNALLYAGKMGLPILLRAGDADLESRGAMHEGEVSNRIGIRGLPAAAEEMGLARLISLVRDTGTAVHVTGISAKESVELLRKAKADDLPISASTPAFNVALIDSSVMESSYDTNFRLTPPLRSDSDRVALVEGIKDGLLAVSSAHTPWSRVEKELEFELSVPGAVGLETAFSATYAGTQDLFATIRALSTDPAKIVGIERRIAVGAVAEIVVVDKDMSWTVEPAQFQTKGRNSPFKGRELPGVVMMTIHAGKVVYKNAAT